MKKILRWINKLLRELIAPTRCIFCGYFSKLFCNECALLLEPYSPICPVCKQESPDYKVHSKCQNETALNQLIVSYHYNDISQKLIEELKYRFNKDVASYLTQYMMTKQSSLPHENFIFVPVPLHPKRLKWRGYNQSEVLIEYIQKSLPERQIATIHLLKRTRHTDAQAKLNRKERLINLTGAFELNTSALEGMSLSSDIPIVLVDDVTTTMSTLNECATVLKTAGYTNIIGWVMARGG